MVDPRSLRYRALLVVVVVVVLPLAWVWTSGWSEGGAILTTRRDLYAAAELASAALDAGRAPEDVARRYSVRVRVLDPDGAVAFDDDATERVRWIADATDPFYGPRGAPDLRAWDDTLPPLGQRAEVREAEPSTPAARCEVAEGGLLLVCSAATLRPDGRVVHVSRGSTRLVRSLYDDRFQLAALTLMVLAIGGVIALYLGVRLVRPIEQLRDRVLSRRSGQSQQRIELDRRDELGELSRAFDDLLDTLDERSRANAAFAADLAHELKNPVAAVRAAAEALASDRPVEGERKERLTRVLADSSRRMELVVDQFLDLARAEAGLPGRERETVDLQALCVALCEGAAADPRNTALVVELTGTCPPIPGVPERLETALRNLLANATHYARRRVTLALLVTPTSVVVSVEDDGPGVPDAERASVFERYHTTREGGTGLGLALVRAVVVAHGGTARLEGGSRFVLELPQQPPG